MRKLKVNSCLLQTISFVVITLYRVKLYVPKEESFPIPLKFFDVTRNTRTSLDVMLEKNMDDYWNVDGDRELSDTWTRFTRFTILKAKPPDGYTWPGWRLTRKQATSRPDKLWPEMWKHMSDAKSESGLSKNLNSIMIREMRNSRIENKKFRCQRQCLVKLQ